MGIIQTKIAICLTPIREKYSHGKKLFEMNEYIYDEHDYNSECNCSSCYCTEQMFDSIDMYKV